MFAAVAVNYRHTCDMKHETRHASSFGPCASHGAHILSVVGARGSDYEHPLNKSNAISLACAYGKFNL